MQYFFYLFYFILCMFSFSYSSKADSIFKETWNNIQTAAEHSKYGKSQWQDLPTGKIRLISCRTGIQDLSKLMTGLELMLVPDWELEDYSFTVVSDNSYKATILPVFKPTAPINGDWTHGYTQHIIFPIHLEDLPKHDINLTIDYTLNLKNLQTEFTYNLSDTLTLPLPATEAYQSDTCAAINHALHTAAIPLEKSQVKLNNELLENGTIRIQIVFPKTISVVDIQGRDKYPIQVQNAQVKGRLYTAVLKTDHPMQADEIIPLNLRTSNGFFTADIQVSTSPVTDIPQPLSLWVAFWTGLLFFLLSPMWSIWFSPQSLSKTTTHLKKQIRKAQVSCLVGIVALGILWQMGLSPTNWITYPAITLGMVIVLFFFIWKPIPSIAGIGILVCLLPKPFWESIASVSGSAKIGLLIWWGCCCCLPLNGWILGSKPVLKFFKQTEKKQDWGYYQVVRLPYWILAGWLVVTGIGYTFIENDPIVHAETILETPAFVRVTSPDCLICLHEKSSKIANKLAPGIKLYQVPSTSQWAKEKREEYKIQAKNFNMLITKTGQEIIIPVGLSIKKTKDILKQNISP